VSWAATVGSPRPFHRIGDTHRGAGRLDEAEVAYLRSIATFGELGQTADQAVVRSALAAAWLRAGQVEAATALIEQAVADLGLGDPEADGPVDGARAWALETLGTTRRANGAPAAARDCHLRSLASFRSRGERYGSAQALVNLGRCATDLGQPDEARALFAEALGIFTEVGNTDGQARVRAELDALASR
jgi:tetratricopeptide (TPR) repeat protein